MSWEQIQKMRDWEREAEIRNLAAGLEDLELDEKLLQRKIKRAEERLKIIGQEIIKIKSKLDDYGAV